MIDLKALVEAIQLAVVEAADQVRLKNISILNDYFVPAKPTEVSLPDGPLVPRMILMNFPIVTAQGPSVHTIEVPLLSIAPPENLFLAEFRVRMKVEFGLDESEHPVLKVALINRSPSTATSRQVCLISSRVTIVRYVQKSQVDSERI